MEYFSHNKYSVMSYITLLHKNKILYVDIIHYLHLPLLDILYLRKTLGK